MRRSIVVLSAGLTLLSAGAALAQNTTPHNLILFVPDGLRALIVTPETAPAMAEIRDKGVNFKNSHSLFPTFTMANASAHGDRPLSRRYRRPSATRSIPAIPSRAGRRHRHPVPRERRGARRCRRAFRRRLSERGNHPEDGARQGLQHRRDRQGRPDPDFRPYRPRRQPRPAFDRGRRFHRRQERRSAFGRNEGRADQGQSSAGNALARRQRQGRRRQDAGHAGAEHRAAGLFRRRRHQGRAADVQGAQQAVRAGVLVARSRRQPAQHRATASTP